MESAGLDTESLLRAYDALVFWFAWAFAVAAFCMASLYVLFLWAECFSSSRRPMARLSRAARIRPSVGAGVSHHWPPVWRIVGSVLSARPHRAA